MYIIAFQIYVTFVTSKIIKITFRPRKVHKYTVFRLSKLNIIVFSYVLSNYLLVYEI